MQPSRYGVYYDLTETPLKIERNGLIFHFSTEVHRMKFAREVAYREARFNGSIGKRVGCKVDLSVLADVQLYRQIEQRGFYVFNESERVGYPCLEKLAFGGLRDSDPDSLPLSDHTMLG